MHGVALDANNPNARASVRRLKNIGCDGVRLVASRTPTFASYMKTLHRGKLGIVLVLTSDSYLTEDYAMETAEYVARYPYVDIFCVGNEWNIQGSASWPPGDNALVQLWNVTAPLLPAGRRYLGGFFMEGVAPARLAALLPRLWPRPDGVDLHPYLDTIPTFADTVRFLHTGGYAVSVCEWNTATPQGVRSFQSLLDTLGVTASMFLPWRSGQPATDNLPGLVSPHTGRLTAIGRSYREALAPTIP